jgi:hypothetical protein
MSKGEFKKNIKSIALMPVCDSLKADAQQIIALAENGIFKTIGGSTTKPDNTSQNDRNRKVESVKSVITKLRLDDKSWRDDMLEKMGRMICDNMKSKGKYELCSYTGEDTTIAKHDGVLRASLHLRDTAYTKSGTVRGKYGLEPYVAFVVTYSVTLDASIYGANGAKLWNKQETMFLLNEEKTVEELFSEEAIKTQ